MLFAVWGHENSVRWIGRSTVRRWIAPRFMETGRSMQKVCWFMCGEQGSYRSLLHSSRITFWGFATIRIREQTWSKSQKDCRCDMSFQLVIRGFTHIWWMWNFGTDPGNIMELFGLLGVLKLYLLSHIAPIWCFLGGGLGFFFARHLNLVKKSCILLLSFVRGEDFTSECSLSGRLIWKIADHKKKKKCCGLSWKHCTLQNHGDFCFGDAGLSS